MRKTAQEQELREAMECLDSLYEAYSSDSWNDSVKDSYEKLLQQQTSYLSRAREQTREMNTHLADLEDIEELLRLAKDTCKQVEAL